MQDASIHGDLHDELQSPKVGCLCSCVSRSEAHDHGVDQPMTHVVMPRELGGSRDALDSFNAYVRRGKHDIGCV